MKVSRTDCYKILLGLIIKYAYFGQAVEFIKVKFPPFYFGISITLKFPLMLP